MRLITAFTKEELVQAKRKDSHRIIKMIEALYMGLPVKTIDSNGSEITICLVEGDNDEVQTVMIIDESIERDECRVIGLDASLSNLHKFAARITDEGFAILTANIALNKAVRRKCRDSKREC